jgi:hypothetical protein
LYHIVAIDEPITLIHAPKGPVEFFKNPHVCMCSEGVGVHDDGSGDGGEAAQDLHVEN